MESKRLSFSAELSLSTPLLCSKPPAPQMGLFKVPWHCEHLAGWLNWGESPAKSITPAIHLPSFGTGCRNSTRSLAGSSRFVVHVRRNRESAPQETMRGWSPEMKSAAGLDDPWTATKRVLCSGGRASMNASTVVISFVRRNSMTLSSVIASGSLGASWLPAAPASTVTSSAATRLGPGSCRPNPRDARHARLVLVIALPRSHGQTDMGLGIAGAPPIDSIGSACDIGANE